tara:strand:+ start:5182 stop:6510 length:1329 start_codon:yes stop_codon:yes gene_type:complete
MKQHTDSSFCGWLPPDDPLRVSLHNEVHTRQSQRIHLPALVVYIAVISNDITLEKECEHLRLLPGQEAMTVENLQHNFLRLRLQDCTLRWERHTEFTSYLLVQHLPETARLGEIDPELLSSLVLPEGWLAGIPGRTFSAIKLIMVHGNLDKPEKMLLSARNWFGGREVVASLVGRYSRSLVVTDFMLRDTGFERILVIAPPNISVTRAGRIAQRLLEIETYRIMALQGLPVAKKLDFELSQAEKQLASITDQLKNKVASEQELLDRLVSLAVYIERLTIENMYRFNATRAYDKMITQRINELKEQAIPGTQIIGEFMWHRLSPAIAKVKDTAQRMGILSERVSYTSALLRTQVNILTEAQNQLLLEKLTRGQELQLQLQRTVESLSIAAISYYVVSLIYYLAKAGQAADLLGHPELITGILIPVVLLIVWYIIRHIHNKYLK